MAALGLAALLTVPLSRWVLRPVRRLDDAVHTLTDGDLTARAEPGQGPPELRRLVADFNRMAEALRASSAQQRALVADASHQLRNPLAALRLRVDALESVLVPGGREDHRLAVGELERLTRVLDDTLALARAQDGADEPVAVDVRECARDRLRAWSAAAALRTPRCGWRARAPAGCWPPRVPWSRCWTRCCTTPCASPPGAPSPSTSRRCRRVRGRRWPRVGSGCG